MANFLKSYIFIKKLATPRLCSLTRKNALWVWDGVALADEEFQSLKQALVTAPILSHWNFSDELCKPTDSCYMGLGVMIKKQEIQSIRL